ncbi:MAG: hypothetical protein HYR85_20575 [Planctomycetes bacterium]|nr:hypothetical protein [Planctomycetota bacterium]MBI3845689.1 hypothetical protein [Planctomycetota bacterium]
MSIGGSNSAGCCSGNPFNLNDNTLIGISPGAGAADPGATDLSASMPFSSTNQPTIYESAANLAVAPPRSSA